MVNRNKKGNGSKNGFTNRSDDLNEDRNMIRAVDLRGLSVTIGKRVHVSAENQKVKRGNNSGNYIHPKSVRESQFAEKQEGRNQTGVHIHGQHEE